MIGLNADDRKPLKQGACRAEQHVRLSLTDRVCQESGDHVWNPAELKINKISIQSHWGQSLLRRKPKTNYYTNIRLHTVYSAVHFRLEKTRGVKV